MEKLDIVYISDNMIADLKDGKQIYITVGDRTIIMEYKGDEQTVKMQDKGLP